MRMHSPHAVVWLTHGPWVLSPPPIVTRDPFYKKQEGVCGVAPWNVARV